MGKTAEETHSGRPALPFPGGDLVMRVKIRLFSNLKQYGPGQEGAFPLDLEVGATVHGLVEALEIPPLVKRVILVNGYHCQKDTVLADGDTVTVFPPMAGG